MGNTDIMRIIDIGSYYFEDKKNNGAKFSRAFLKICSFGKQVFYFSCDPHSLVLKMQRFFFSLSLFHFSNMQHYKSVHLFFFHTSISYRWKICAAGEGTQSDYKNGLEMLHGLCEIRVQRSAILSHVFYVNWLSRRQMVSKLLFFAQRKH